MRAHGFIFLAVFFALVQPSWGQSIELSEVERAHLDAKGRITMCVDPAWMPYEKIDETGHHIGIAADFMKMFSGMLGVPIELVPTQSWNESLELARVRSCDILSLLNETEDRAQYLNFTDPYLDAVVVLVARDEVVFLDGFKDLSGRTLGVVKGYAYESYIRKNHPNVRMVYVDNLDDAFARVSRGELFAAVDSLFIVTHHIQALGYSNLKIAGQTQFTHALRVGVRKDDPLLLSAFQKAVKAVDPVRRNQLLQRWFSVRIEHGTNLTVVWQILIAAALVGGFVGYRYWVQKRFNAQLQEKNRELERLSQTDPLTGIFNRLKMDALLDQEYERARRYERTLSVVMYDLDHFKRINDQHGHQMGDRVLVEISALVRDNLRKHDMLARWGGEEFLILCPETDIDGAVRLADNLRRLIAGLQIEGLGSFQASFGVAQLGAADDVNRLLGHADAALYDAKAAGRNRVCRYTPSS